MAPTEQGVTSTSSPITEFLTFVVSGGDCLTNNGVHLACVIPPARSISVYASVTGVAAGMSHHKVSQGEL